MCVIILFILSQTWADTTWPMYGATLENTHYQKMVGAMDTEPDVKWFYVTGSFVEAHGAAVADVDGDDTTEVVIGSCDKKVYCLNGVDGIEKWSFPTGGEVYSSPAVADVNEDDTMEVVIGSCDFKVYCINGVTGLEKWSFPTSIWHKVISSPAVANVDGIAGMEVVVGSTDKKVYCLDGADGHEKWSHPTGDEVRSSAAIADVDGDGNMEVVIGSYDNKVYCLRGIDGTEKWVYTAGSDVHRGISVADIDGDDTLEVLVPNMNTNKLTCLNGEDKSVLWTKSLDTDIHDITIADIDMDGYVELIVGTRDSWTIWALDDDVSASVEEKRELKVKSLEFRVMGKGIYLFTPNAIEVDIKLYDLCGRLKQVIYRGVLSKSGHTFMPNIKDSGVYFVVLNSQGIRESVKLINLLY